MSTESLCCHDHVHPRVLETNQAERAEHTEREGGGQNSEGGVRRSVPVLGASSQGATSPTTDLRSLPPPPGPAPRASPVTPELSGRGSPGMGSRPSRPFEFWLRPV